MPYCRATVGGRRMSASVKEELTSLERRVDDLIQVCRRLREENHSLRASRESLLQERTTLAEKNRLARNRLEQIIERLRSLEQQAETRQ